MQKSSKILILAIMLSFICAQDLFAAKKVYIQNGVLDLRSWNVQSDPVLEIHGEWHWYASGFYESAAELRKLPDSNYQSMDMAKNSLQDQWGTLHAEILLPKAIDKQILAIWMENFITNARLYVDYGQHIDKFEKGQPAATEIDEIASVENILHYTVLKNDRLDFLVHRSFLFQFTNYPIFIGQPQALANKLKIKYLLASVTIGMLILIGLYNLSIYSLHRENSANLMYAIASLMFILRQMVTSGIVYDFYSWQSRAWIFLILYTTLFGAFQAGLSFILLAMSESFHSRILKHMGRLLFAFSIPFGLIVTSSIVFFNSKMPLQIGTPMLLLLMIVTIPSCFYILFKKYKFNHRTVKLAVSSLTILVAAFVWDRSVGMNSLDLPFVVDYALVVMMFLQTQITGVQFAKAFRQVEHLSKNLRQEVDKKTEKLSLQKQKLEEQQSELMQTHQNLQTTDLQKTQFFQNISHELRTPLTLILASQKSLLEKYNGDEDVQVAERNSRRLLRLVNQLLDFQKQSQGNQVLRLVAISLNDFLTSCADYIKKSCDSKSIRLERKGFEENAHILGEFDALEKVVFNYLSNALKYTPNGGLITLGIEINNFRVRFYVKDSGPGISIKDQDKLFKVFSQVDGTERSYHEGTGLGLALVKELVTKMNGSVGIDSASGQGCCFWADFPLINEDKNFELLLVDDEQETIDYFEQKLLKKTRINRYKFAKSAEYGLEMLAKYRFSCVVSDAVLPGMDGPTFLMRVAEMQPDAQRILITGREQSHKLVQKAINVAKIERVLFKPLGDEAYSIIEEAVNRRNPTSNKPVHDLLLIDDDPQFISALMQQIQNSSLIEDIHAALNLKEAKNILNEHCFKLVLCDADLGNGERGSELLEFLYKTEPRTKRVMLTAERRTETVGEAINRAKIDEILYKPIDFKEIIASINRLINQSTIIKQWTDTDANEVKIKDWHLADFESEDRDLLPIPNLDRDPTTIPDQVTVLVCDDVPDMRNLMRRSLIKVGYNVVVAKDGRDALALIQKTKVDLIVTDWMMPHMTGPDLIRAIHNDEAYRSIPTILLTAKSDEESKIMASRIGSTAYLAKPFDEMELQTTAYNLIELKRSERKVAELNRYLTETILCRFLPPKLVEQVIAGKLIISEKPAMMPVTILFSDLCNFTKISEELGPVKISDVLNDFFENMSHVIFEYRGTIDKFIGDSIMVIFGAPESIPVDEQIKNAAECAVKMQEHFQRLNEGWMKNGVPEFKMRIALHHGSAVVGQFGSELRSEYTAIGPTVNYAARMESVAEPGSIFISAIIRDSLNFGCEMAGTYDLKGIGQEPLFRLLDVKRGGKNEAA